MIKIDVFDILQLWGVFALLGAFLVCLTPKRKVFLDDFYDMILNCGFIEVITGLILYYICLPISIIYSMPEIVEMWWKKK
jgi:hypothetical protein